MQKIYLRKSFINRVKIKRVFIFKEENQVIKKFIYVEYFSNVVLKYK